MLCVRSLTSLYAPTWSFPPEVICLDDHSELQEAGSDCMQVDESRDEDSDQSDDVNTEESTDGTTTTEIDTDSENTSQNSQISPREHDESDFDGDDYLIVDGRSRPSRLDVIRRLIDYRYP